MRRIKSGLWVPNGFDKGPAVITRRALLTGAAALAGASILGLQPAFAASSYTLLGHAHDEQGGTTPPSVTVDTTGADFFFVCCHGVSGGVTGSQQYTDSKNAVPLDTLIVGLGGYPDAGVSLSYNSQGLATSLALPFTVGAGHTFTAGANSFYSGIDVAWFSGSYLTAAPYNADEADNGANTGTPVANRTSQSITPPYNGCLVAIAAMMSGLAGVGTVSIPTAGWTADEAHNTTPATAIGGILGHQIQGAAAATSANVQFDSETGQIFTIIASFRPASYVPPGGGNRSLSFHSTP